MKSENLEEKVLRPLVREAQKFDKYNVDETVGVTPRKDYSFPKREKIYSAAEEEKILALIKEGKNMEAIAGEIGRPLRSTYGKIISLKKDYDFVMPKMAKGGYNKTNAEIKGFLEENPGVYTYKELADLGLLGAYSSKELQGKILSMRLTGLVKYAEQKYSWPPKRYRTYSQAEEEKILALVKEGKSIQEIAIEMDRSTASMIGKIGSLRKEHGLVIPSLYKK